MYKKIKNSSFMNLLWFIIYLLPLICLGLYVWLMREQNFELSYLSSDGINSFLSVMKKFIGGDDGWSSILSVMYQKIFGIFLYGNGQVSESSQFFRFVCGYISYCTYITLIHLAFDFLMLLPNICHKFMEKVGGDRD